MSIVTSVNMPKLKSTSKQQLRPVQKMVSEKQKELLAESWQGGVSVSRGLPQG